MKALLALTIILGGVLITKNSYGADFSKSGQSLVIGSNSVRVSGYNPAAHSENTVDCVLKSTSTAKHGQDLYLTGSSKGTEIKR